MFNIYDQPLSMLSPFFYLVQTLMTMDKYWPAVVGNLWKAIWTWAHRSWILGREGVDSWTSGQFYLLVVHATLLFGSEK